MARRLDQPAAALIRCHVLTFVAKKATQSNGTEERIADGAPLLQSADGDRYGGP